MSQGSAIEWTEATWNPVRGCVKVSPGCANCYAKTFAERWRGVAGHPYEQGFDLRLVPEKLAEPLRRKKPTTYFVNSMSDLFKEGVPDGFIDRVFAVMALCPRHTFQVLTKRADRMRSYLTAHDIGIRWLGSLYTHFTSRRETDDLAYQERDAVNWTRSGLDNVWLGVSVENQHFADERIPLLLQTPAAVRFVSAEPLLGPIVLRDALHRWRERPGLACHAYRREPNERIVPGLDWVIAGGESGPKARPCHVEWIAEIVQACRAAGVPVFVKQMGSVPYVRASRLRHWEWRTIKRPEEKRFTEAPDDALGWRVHLADRKGGDMAEWPVDLRVREFPRVRA